MVTDSHAHLNDENLASFMRDYARRGERECSLTIVSNSVDQVTSQQNLRIAEVTNRVKAFVGIHPQVFLDPHFPKERERIDAVVSSLEPLVDSASGIGEVGLDETYGKFEEQSYLFSKMLGIVEENSIPVTIHTRGTLKECVDALSTIHLRSNVLFHWFSGSSEEIGKLHERGYFTSFGPSILYSKRMQNILKMADPRFILAETDAPLRLESVRPEFVATPFFVISVLFKMSLILGNGFENMTNLNEENARNYLQTQT